MFWGSLVCLALLAIFLDSFRWKLVASWFVITYALIALRVITGIWTFIMLAKLSVVIMIVAFVVNLCRWVINSK